MADQGRLDELKRKFDENPKRYFAPLANEYRKAGDPERALELCRTYLPQQPTHMSGYIVYGQALHDAGQADESAAVFKQALTLDPENIIALRHLGDISRDAGDNVGAMRWYGKVLELDPRNEEIAAFITSLAQPGSTEATPPRNERPAPPTVRPEPAHDDSAVRLEDIVSEPDVPQATSPGEDRHAGVGAPAIDWPGELYPGESAQKEAEHQDAETSAVRENREVAEGSSPNATERADAAGPPLRFSDFLPEEHTPFAASDDDLGAPAPEAQSQARDDSPFVTETMAELYLQQGLHGEALLIYRQLALKRDDPELRQRIATLESRPSPRDTGETVRGFFERIGRVRPNERVVLAADGESSLSALFGAAQPSADDLSAAQRLSGAFGDPRSRGSHS